AARIRELAPAKHGWQLEPSHHGGDVGSCGKPERGNADEHTLYVCAHDLGGYGVEVPEGAYLDELYCHTNRGRRGRQARDFDAVRWIVGIEQGTNAREARYRELEKIEPLTHKRVVNEIPCSGYIAARSCSALRIPCCNRIFGKDHDDRNCPRYGVCGQSTGRRAGDNDSGLSATSSRASGSMLSGAPFP